MYVARQGNAQETITNSLPYSSMLVVILNALDHWPCECTAFTNMDYL